MLLTSFTLSLASWREVWKSYLEVGSSSSSPTCAEEPIHRQDWHTHGKPHVYLRTHEQADNQNTQNSSSPRLLILQTAHVLVFSHSHRHTDPHTDATALPDSAVAPRAPRESHMNAELSLMRIPPNQSHLQNSHEISTCVLLKIIVWKRNKV